MDINCTRYTVKSEVDLFNETSELSLEGTFQLKGAYPAEKILKCCYCAAITSKTLTDKTATVDGTVQFNIIYINRENELCTQEYTIPFSKTFESERRLSDGVLSAEITDERFAATLSDNGAVSLTGTLTVEVAVRLNTECQVICDIDNENIEQLSSNAELTMPMGKNEKILIIEEEISVGNAQPSVGRIIRHSETVTVDEAKIISDKVMVKGNIRVYVLYLPEEGTRPQSFEEAFPFSQLIDVDGIGEGCRCDADAKLLFCELTPHMNNDDEIRSFSVAAKLSVTVTAYCDNGISVVTDAYSTAGECTITRKPLNFNKICENIDQSFTAKKELEFTDGAIGSVIDMWCELRNYSCRVEAGEMKLYGTLTVNLLVYDCDGVPNCYERPMDFEYCGIIKEGLLNPHISCKVTIAHCSYTIIGANTVSITVEPRICAAIYDGLSYELITDICLSEKGESEAKKNGSIVLYFAEEGERVWDIARRYNSSVEEIKVLNDITDDVLKAAKKFIIPTK